MGRFDAFKKAPWFSEKVINITIGGLGGIGNT